MKATFRSAAFATFFLFAISLIHAQVSPSDPRFEKSGFLQITVTSMKGVPKQGETIIFQGTRNPNRRFEGISDSKGKFDIWLPKGDVYQLKIMAIGAMQAYNTIEIPDKPGAYQGKYQIQFELPVSVSLDNVLFETGKSIIKPASFSALDDLAALLKRKERLVILVVGHTDDQGTDASNQTLSLQRAEAVMNYLLKKSGAQGRITAEGKGASEPIADNATEEGRRQNRRTEIRVLQE